MNEQIEKSRGVALEILRPSPRELEHGLELHNNSLVFDAYGFSPRAAVDADALEAAAEAGASDVERQDLAEDMTMTRCVADEAERREYLAAWEAAGVTCVFQNAGQEGQDPSRIIKRLARFTYVTDMLREFVQKAATPDDIVAAKKQGRRCLYLSTNGVPLTQRWVSVEDELRYIRVFFQLGVRMMHLAYSRRNMIGDGCSEPGNAGLSDFGRAVVKEMNRVGVIVDVAHGGWRTSLEAAEVSERPIVASHTGCAALNNHIRCKPDEVIRAIADKGGCIGICCVPAFLGGSGDVRALLDHVDYVAKRFGVGTVAIGTDMAYASSASRRERKSPRPRRPRRPAWSSFCPPDDPIFDPAWNTERQLLSMAWTNWPLFTVGLVQRGYSDDDIQKILGGNTLRVAREVFAVARR